MHQQFRSTFGAAAAALLLPFKRNFLYPVIKEDYGMFLFLLLHVRGHSFILRVNWMKYWPILIFFPGAEGGAISEEGRRGGCD